VRPWAAVILIIAAAMLVVGTMDYNDKKAAEIERAGG